MITFANAFPGELAAAVRRKNITFGLYHSLFEWFNPLFVHDKNNNFSTNLFPTVSKQTWDRSLTFNV